MKKIILILVIAMSSKAFSQAEPLEGPLVHTVLFWLNKPDNASDRADFEKAIKELMATNPQAIKSHLGRPASTEQRDVVDNSYTYLYMMTFANAEDEAAYQIDPTHLKFVESANHLWKKVVVYDSSAID